MADSQRKTAQIVDVTAWFAAMNVANGTKELITGGFKIISTGGDTYIGEAFKSPSIWNANRQAQSIEVEAETTYTISTTAFPKCFISYADSSFNTLNSAYIRIPNGTSYTFTTPENCKYIIFRMGEELSSGQEVQFPNIMLNKGNQPLPYEPYGWLHSLRKLTTATEAVENPLYSDGTAITAYTLKGNEEHTGTPSPQNPVEVQGVGVRTANLYNYQAKNIANGYKSGYRLNNGEEVATGGYNISEYIPVKANTDYILQLVTSSWSTSAAFYDSSYNQLSYIAYHNVVNVELPTPTDTAYMRISVNSDEEAEIMLAESSTAIPFEPYGYKIPISSGQQTTNIYLGSTQTVRKVKKYVYTGTEDSVTLRMPLAGFFTLTIEPRIQDNMGYAVSTHYQTAQVINVNMPDLSIKETTTTATETGAGIIIKDTRYTTLADFKAYLAQQYANGTPVTVWYCLTTAETGIVNEPLMKLVGGDSTVYADTLSNAASIPTTEGANSITVDTTVQPSEFTATWTGWHDASVKEKSENLFDGVLEQGSFNTEGEPIVVSTRVRTTAVTLSSGQYSINAGGAAQSVVMYVYQTDNTFLPNESVTGWVGIPTTMTVAGDRKVRFGFRRNDNTNIIPSEVNSIMLNTGETALPHEPYWK